MPASTSLAWRGEALQAGEPRSLPMLSEDDDVFGEVFELSPAGRAAFLERTCGNDPERRARIEAILAGFDAAGDFLEVPGAERPALAGEEKPGDVLGHYTLIEKLGEGGCGTVYLAEQKIPVRRKVALKVIKLGMDTRSVITRFEGERQALAMMDHPDIARVFDAGATEAGRPFFVMEFVAGVPITKFCDEHRLPIAERLELFARACLALQHAHQKGIIHRDVKPSNILVAMRDGVPAPKIIDFGIAKATQDRITEHTLVTGVDQFIGTPCYMSPEQADQRDADIDTRTDVYALGVVLDEMLTGSLPFSPDRFAGAGVERIREIIRDVEPPRPSACLTALNPADRARAADARGVGATQLIGAVRGDLDWIVVKCLEKDRARRYPTAQDLAEDVRRHLHREPVEARPPNTLYRVERFAARHRLACTAAAAIVLTLIGATIISVRQAIIATRAEHAEALARADAQRRQAQAEGVLNFMLGDFRAEVQKSGTTALLNALDDKATGYFTRLNPRDLTDTFLAQQAKELYQIGETKMDQASFADASAAFVASYERAAALADRHPKNGDMLFERAQAEYWIGFVARKRGDMATVAEWFTRYRDSAVALVAIEGSRERAQRELTSAHHNLAVMESDRSNLPAAQAGFLAEQTAVIGMLAANPADPVFRYRMADIASWLGSVAERDGRYAEAIRRYEEMAVRCEDLITLEPTTVRWQLALARSLTFSANVKALLGRRGEAAETYARALVLLERLVAHDPENRQWQLNALDVQLQQVALLLAAGDPVSAEKNLTVARENIAALVATEPTSKAFTIHLATASRLEGRIRLATRRPDVDEPIARALELGGTLLKESRPSETAMMELAQSCLLAGRVALARGEPATARGQWSRAYEVLAPRLPASNNWRLLDPAAQSLLLLGRTAEARPLVERLNGFGYRSTDPAAASLLEAAAALISAEPSP